MRNIPDHTKTVTVNARTPPSLVDVLIIGAGPAGCMLGVWLSRLGVRTRIIDKSATRVGVGHADGFQCRTMEVFQSFGVAHKAVAEANEVAEVAFYNPDENGHLRLSDRIPDTDPGTSQFRHVLLAQGRVEQILLDAMRDFNNLEVERLTIPTSLSVSSSPSILSDPNAHAITIGLRTVPHPSPLQPTTKMIPDTKIPNGLFRSNLFVAVNAPAPVHMGEEAGRNESEVKARFVVGCDGAHSWTRQAIGYDLKGDSANVFWGVIDTRPVTSLPTIRLKNVIHSAHAGSILTVPRERGLVRFYINLGTFPVGQRPDRAEYTLEKMLAIARAILHPHTIDFPEVEWWTIYEVGQRLCDHFSAHYNRVFVAGDACHVHSAKSGQGMNISMMDTYNLGWKIAAVVKHQAPLHILETYESERRMVAKELITFDHKFSRLFSGKPASKTEMDGISLEEFRSAFIQSKKWASGTAVRYKPSLLVEEETNTQLATGIVVGSHFESHQVVNVASACPLQLQHRLVSDGHWRIIVFAGDIVLPQQRERLDTLCVGLEALITIYTADVLEILTVTSTPRLSVILDELPEVLFPKIEPYGYRSYDSVLSDDDTFHEGHGHAYTKYGVDKVRGCVVVVRPDQYVSGVHELEQSEMIARFFSGCLLSN